MNDKLTDAGLFNADGRLFLLDDGRLVAVTKTNLSELIRRRTNVWR